MYHTILTYSTFRSFFLRTVTLFLEFKEKNHDKVFAT